MDTEPHQPCEEAGEMNSLADAGDGMEPGDGRHAALVEVLEGLARRLSAEPAYDLAGRVLATPAWRLGHARQVVQRHHVAHDENLRMSGQGEIRVHLHPTGAIDLGTTLFGELLPER